MRKPGYITTIAGKGPAVHGGDGGLATEASFFWMADAIETKNGDVYIADTDAHVVRKVNSSGIITTIAGMPSQRGTSDDLSDDGGPATNAKLNFPRGLYFDEKSGSLYITDMYNHRIRMVDSMGKIFTVAGKGISGFSGDDGFATSASLTLPLDIVGNDKGELFIADTDNNRIRKVGTDKKISTIAGNGNEGDFTEGEAINSPLKGPASLALNDEGELLFVSAASSGAYFVLKIGIDGNIQKVAGNGVNGFSGDGGPAVNASFGGEIRIAVGKDGEVYISDKDNYRIRMINSAGIISTIAGDGQERYAGNGGPAKKASFIFLACVNVAPNGDLYVCDDTRVRLIYASSISCFGLSSEDPNVCSGHGNCSSTDACICDEDYTGKNCSEFVGKCFGIQVTDPTVCSGHGSCTDIDQCKCDEEWMGIDCSITHCFGFTSNVPDLVCSGRGTCVQHNKCRCKEGYRGSMCQRSPTS